MKVSKVVLIVVALHVLVIGGIFIFEGCSRAKAPGAELAATGNAPGDETAATATALPAPVPVEPAASANLTPVAPAAPAPAVASAPVATPTARTYVVKKGDSLWKVAKTEGVSIGDLAKANNLTRTSVLKIGAKLQVPAAAAIEPTVAAAASTGGTAAPAIKASVDAGGQMYTVKSGDSLWKVARSHNLTVAALKQANNLTTDTVKVGQKLHISSTPGTAPVTTASAVGSTATPTTATGTALASAMDWHEPGPAIENGQNVHYVDFGESPAIIAKKYSVKVDDLMKVNNISDARRIVVGQKLIIPTAQQPAATPAVAAPIVSVSQVPAGN